ncbi:antibiotic biosynthesis monooxygenase [Paenibacillus baekrokdamisoli]|uniref:Antibiotic biosynthesis monooxygenase n=1 Tax=Paenibacillus baekrokdamisoli TaxID=1712516 RepID=A0A3G9J7V9_9BACL|nr:antibiotic biosynthesis monooxygenase [Paenibacillus baekrokdamisoli]MBB3067459.1 heme-degrading monooxygenase HmoA [Paenibacillus baekrokdamisoli]BBH19354.1 antibiotic biosynthesis monooxygenase [Paenibacillus baekrokdamisoli]
MILEVAVLNVKLELNDTFISTFKQASAIISTMDGYIRHELQHCVENDNQYILLVWWETLEDHVVGFRTSPQYEEWKSLLHHYYDPFPTVEHYENVDLT